MQSLSGWAIAAALCALLPACASESQGPTGPDPLPTTGPTAVPSGCANGAPVCIDAPPDGFVIESVGTMIEPGQDIQYCEVVALPGTPGVPIYVSGIDGKMTPF